MSRTDTRDPVAALEALEHAFMHNAAPEGMLRELTERGYVLVNAEGLRRTLAALWEKRYGPLDGDPAKITIFGAMAHDILAAIKEQQ